MLRSNEISSDEDIIRDVLDGDTEAFTLIVERYQDRIFSIGMRFLKNEDDSRDYTQNLFINVYDRLESYQGRGSFKSWLVRAAYNQAIDAWRACKPEADLDHETEAAECGSGERELILKEIKDILNRAVAELPDNYKICIDLYFFWGLSHEEISNITDIPLNTIKSNVLRAKKILRSKLSGTLAEEYHEV